ncbi:hypothetical protein, partial [Allorhizocola rhizosphaerae]|uniref:hypothetical protein n=1 Tax=Allorhizocola rhizosphaerae TaxID=1872709 RepID=UPI001B8D4D37
ECGDAPTEARAMIYAGHFGALIGDLDAGLDVARRGLDLAEMLAAKPAERADVRWVRAEGLMILGMLNRLAGDAAQARSISDSAVVASEACGHSWAAAGAAWTAMKSAMDAGDPGHALKLATRVLVPLDAAADITSWLILAHTTAAALAQTGRTEDAAVLLGAVVAHGSRIGFSPELMDPVDGPREASAVRSALPAGALDDCLARGSTLSRAQVNQMIMSGSTVPLGNGLERSSK